MPLLDILHRLAPARSTGLVISCSVASTLAAIALARLTLQTASPKSTPSPRVTQLSKLSEIEQAKLPYPPDVLPGARDADSPVSHVKRGAEI